MAASGAVPFPPHAIVIRVLPLFLFFSGATPATFTFSNNCEYTVWPGVLANAGTAALETTGFELPSETYRVVQAPAGWSGRFWGRTGCHFDGSGSSSTCDTGDCGSQQLECLGNGAAIPVTLAEFTLGTTGLDFYDVSLVDGFNVPILVQPTSGNGKCGSTGCLEDLNLQCPPELRSSNSVACRSACAAFGSPEYCCSGDYNSPASCHPSVYSSLFKMACPRSYSYAYDDASSTFTCAGADYTITFCPSVPSQKSTTTSSYTTPSASTGERVQGSVAGSGTVSSVTADGSWLAGLAMGDSRRIRSSTSLQIPLVLSVSLFLVFLA